jgi:hypothetical protein
MQVLGNPGDVARGEKTHFGREAVRFAGKYTPDMVYTRLATDRLLWDSLQKMVDDDYRGVFQRIEDRARKDQGVGYWWRPGQTAPTRAP